MAEVFGQLQARVLACDISPAMLTVAEKEFAQFGVSVVDFKKIDIMNCEDIYRSGKFVVCWRLMQRVPRELIDNILVQLSKVAPVIIISFAGDSIYGRIRYYLRKMIFGGAKSLGGVRIRRRELESLLEERFVIEYSESVLPGVSAQRAYILRLKSDDL